ncbi:MAG: YraN family protein [Epsilonproteobacteria bacterium]|nr:YraN family protein [Campylobacterota bacterium]
MSREKGNIAEDRACEYLKSLGFSIVDRNFYSRFGEIDIIALKDGILHFVEVKSSIDSKIDPVYNITYKKLSKIKKSISYYILKNQITMSYCIDAIIVRKEEIEFLENITF